MVWPARLSCYIASALLHLDRKIEPLTSGLAIRVQTPYWPRSSRTRSTDFEVRLRAGLCGTVISIEGRFATVDDSRARKSACGSTSAHRFAIITQPSHSPFSRNRLRSSRANTTGSYCRSPRREMTFFRTLLDSIDSAQGVSIETLLRTW